MLEHSGKIIINTEIHKKNDNEQEQNQANHVAIISINGTVNRVPEGWGRRHKTADPYTLWFLRFLLF